MSTIFQKVQELEEVSSLSKHEQVVNGVMNAIDDKIVTQGSKLPSVNQMVKELGFASKTIVKAYSELKERGLVDSKKRHGYFVVNEDTDQNLKIAMLLYSFHPFQEEFYNAFRETCGENVQVDVFFHHSNIDIFETILKNAQGKYGKYVIAPIPHPNTKSLLDIIPRNKLLLVDRYEALQGVFSHVTQEFRDTTYAALETLSDSIKKFNEIILFYLPDSDYPVEVLEAFQRFLKDFGINGRVEKSYKRQSVEAGKVYFTIGDGDLWKLLKDATTQNLEIGKDLGVLSYNDNPVKEIICGGITTFSTNFELMGKTAAEVILSGKHKSMVIPTNLYRRTSL